jgi:hypothetical protein
MSRKTLVRLVSVVAVVVATTFVASPAAAQRRHGRIVITGGYGFGPHLYDPFWAPYPYGPYLYGPYPYDGVALVEQRPFADVRVLATPKEAAVYLDGEYAGVVGDFDGVFSRLHTTPGGHAVTLYLEGYRTVTRNIYVAPDGTLKLQLAMEKLGPDEVSAPPPKPARDPNSRPVPPDSPVR